MNMDVGKSRKVLNMPAIDAVTTFSLNLTGKWHTRGSKESGVLKILLLKFLKYKTLFSTSALKNRGLIF